MKTKKKRRRKRESRRKVVKRKRAVKRKSGNEFRAHYKHGRQPGEVQCPECSGTISHDSPLNAAGECPHCRVRVRDRLNFRCSA
ncbi:MAG: hypothetical protein ACPGO5_00850 [Patescibacteria group bacterium]